MPLKVNVPYRKTFLSKKSSESTFNFLAELEKAIPNYFPGLESFTKQKDYVYLWKFKKVKYHAYEIQIQVLTQFEIEPGRVIKMHSISRPGYSELTGSWTVAAENAGSKTTFEVDLKTELSIPFFLKAVVSPIAQKEIEKVFDRYLENVEKALS